MNHWYQTCMKSKRQSRVLTPDQQLKSVLDRRPLASEKFHTGDHTAPITHLLRCCIFQNSRLNLVRKPSWHSLDGELWQSFKETGVVTFQAFFGLCFSIFHPGNFDRRDVWIDMGWAPQTYLASLCCNDLLNVQCNDGGIWITSKRKPHQWWKENAGLKKI